MGSYIRKTVCPYDCPMSCGLLAGADGIRLLSVKDDPDYPAAKGLICRRARHYEKPVHSPEHILISMKQADAKGEGGFEPVTWDGAVKEIAGKWSRTLREDGAGAILPIYYSGVMSVLQCKCGDAFFNRVGIYGMVRTLCSSVEGAGHGAVMGQTGCLDSGELKDSSFYLVWESNMKTIRLQFMPALTQARRQKKRVVLIESCVTDMKIYCNQITLIRPGTDGALALAMMHVMEEENLADRDFLAHQTNGYEAFRKTLTSYTPAWAKGETGIPVEVIAGLSGEYALVPAPAIVLGSSPPRCGSGGMTVRLITISSVYAGAWGRPGDGLHNCNPRASSYTDDRLVTRPDFREKPGRRVNINEIVSALIGNRGEKFIYSFYVYGGNPVVSVCCQKRILKDLLRLDLFTVIHERFIAGTTIYVDILLPATFSTEQTDVYTTYGYRTFGTARKIAELAGQSKSNWNTFHLLVQAMGYGEGYFKRTEEKMVWELLVHPTGGLAHISEKRQRMLGEGGVISAAFADHRSFRTFSSETMIYSESLEETMPRCMKSRGGAYPLRLVAMPGAYTLNLVFMDREDLSSGKGPMTLVLHPRDVAVRKIADGSHVTAFNELVRVEFIAKITPVVAEGTAATGGAYNRTSTKDGFLVSALHHERPSDIGATTTLNDNTMDVRPC